MDKQMERASIFRNRTFKSWYIVFVNALIGCCLAATFPQFSMTINELSIESGISESILLTSDTIKSCGIVAAMLVSGFMYNRFGANKLFIYTMLAAIVPHVLLPHNHMIWALMVLKFMQGTASIIFPVFLVIILNWVHEKDAGLSTAVFNGIFYGGGGIGGTLAGFVIANSSWVMSYYTMAVIQLVLGVIWLLTVRERPSEDYPRDTDLPEKLVEARPRPDKKNLLLSSRVWLLAISFFATAWVVQAITVDMPIFAKFLGYEEIEISKLLTAVTVGMMASCLLSGKISDFFAVRSRRKDLSRLIVFTLGYIITIIAVIFIVFADTSSFSIFYVATLLLTFGGSWGLGAFYSILPEIYDDETVPIITGITGGMGDAGMPIAPLVVGVCFGIKGMWEIGWTTCAVIALISMLATVILLLSLKNSKK